MRAAPIVRAVLVAGLALAGLAAGAPSARAQVVVGVQAGGIQVAPGGRITVPVVVDMTGSGGFSLGSFAATLWWRASTLRFVGATSGGFAAPVLNPDSATGALQFAAANPAGATGRVVVLLATFDATGAAGDTTSLTFTVNELTAASSFTSLTPVTTPSLVCVGSSSGTWGDLDNSGTVTSFDALLVVTHAVGLPITPNSPTLGDVDADGRVTTRDALIILSHVVGLPTTPHRPGQTTSLCTGNPPAVVQAQPSALALVIGDTVAATARVTDSVGQVVGGPGLAWTTLDAAVATVTPSGRVAAVGAGVTGAVVVAAPGVMDTVAVTVVTTRRLWYVDATAAAQNLQETGSPAYPFGTLQQAVDRAAPNDTVYVRGGVYGTGARSTTPLAIIGHPSYVAPSFGGAIVFDSMGADTVRLQRLLVRDAPTGIRAHSLGGGALLLDSVVVERAQGHGIEVANFDSVALDRVRVLGAVDKGITAVDVRALSLFAVDVDGISLASGPGTGTALLALRAQLVDADSSSFRLGDVVLDTVADVRFHRVQVAETYGSLFTLNAGASVVFDTVSFRMGGSQGYLGEAVTLRMQPGGSVFGREVEIRQISGNGLLVTSAGSAAWEHLFVEAGGAGGRLGSSAAAFAGVGRVEVRGGSFRDGTVFHADTLGSAMVMRLDTVDFQRSHLVVRGLDTLAFRVGSVTGGGSIIAALLDADTVQVVSLVGVEVTGQAAIEPAVRVAHGDSLRADSLYVHHNASTGLYVDQLRAASSVGSRFTSNAQAAAYNGNVQVFNVPVVRVAQGLFEEAGSVISLAWMPGSTPGPVLRVDTTVFRGSVTAVNVASASSPSVVTVRGSRLERNALQRGGVFLQSTVRGRVELFDNQVDSTTTGGSYVVNLLTDTLTAVNNLMRGVSGGIQASSFSADLAVTLSGNTVECHPNDYTYGFTLSGVRGVLAGNTARRCDRGGIFADASSGTGTLELRGNTITDVGASAYYGIGVQGAWRRVVVAQNTIQRGGTQYAGIFLYGSPIDTARVDSNTVQDGVGPGIRSDDGTRLFSLRGNLVERQGFYVSSGEAALWVNGGFGPDSLIVAGNRVQQNKVFGINLGTAAPVRLDSNVVVDDSLDAVRINSASVTGRSNFLARNGGDGIFANGAAGPITMTQSVIQQNAVGARFVSGLVTLANNYWGDVLGPDCDTGCAGARGDSLVGSANLNYLPFLTSAPTTPTGAPPAMRPSAPVSAAVTPIRSKAVEPAWFERLRAARRAPAGGER